MDVMRQKKEKKGLIGKTWERCKSIGRGGGGGGRTAVPRALIVKSKSWPSVDDDAPDEMGSRKRRVAPEGCFTVYVGPDRERFVIRTECANHTLFKMLLEEAESEFGYCSEGPIWLPCNVDVFCQVLLEMDGDGDDMEVVRPGCGFARSPSPYRLLSPSPAMDITRF